MEADEASIAFVCTESRFLFQSFHPLSNTRYFIDLE